MNLSELKANVLKDKDGAEKMLIMDAISRLYGKNPAAVINIAATSLATSIQMIKDDEQRNKLLESVINHLKLCVNRKVSFIEVPCHICKRVTHIQPGDELKVNICAKCLQGD